MIALWAAAGCAGSFWAAGPGGSGVQRKASDGFVVTGGGYGYVTGYRVPGAVHAGGGGIGMSLGTKLGATYGAFGERDRVMGIGSEPHLDLVFIPASDRWSATATAGWVFRSLYYDDADDIAYHGFAPSLSVHYALRRRLWVHVGAGYTFGSIKIAPEVADMATSTGAGELRALGGMSWVFRRTPRLDIVLRVELNAYRSDEVTVLGETGRLQGAGVTFQAIWSTF